MKKPAKARNYVKKYMDEFSVSSTQDCRKTKMKRGYVKHKRQVRDYLDSSYGVLV